MTTPREIEAHSRAQYTASDRPAPKLVVERTWRDLWTPERVCGGLLMAGGFVVLFYWAGVML